MKQKVFPYACQLCEVSNEISPSKNVKALLKVGYGEVVQNIPQWMSEEFHQKIRKLKTKEKSEYESK